MKDFFAAHSGEVFALINAVLVIVILPMLGTWLRGHLNKDRAERLEIAMQSGLQSAMAALTKGHNSTETIKAVLNDENVRNAVVGEATDYVRETVPKAVNKLGLDENLEKVINARVEAAVAELAAKYTVANKAIAAAAAVDNAQGPQQSV